MKRKLSLYVVDTAEDIKIDEVADDENELYFIEGEDYLWYLRNNKTPLRIVSRELRELMGSIPDSCK